MTAMMGDIDMARELSKTSSFVQESKKSPHFQRMVKGLAEIAARSNHLSEGQLDQLEKDRRELYVAQNINSIKTIDGLDTVNRYTAEMGAILSKHSDALIAGKLSIATNFSTPVVEVLKDAAYGGTTGMRIKADGTRDHTSKRINVASNVASLRDLGNLSSDDKARLHKVVSVINESDVKDPFEGWVRNDAQISEAREARKAKMAAKSGEVSVRAAPTTSNVDWGSFL